MKLLLKIIAFAIGGVIIFMLLGMGALSILYPKKDSIPDISVEGTQSQIDRGAYLANNVTGCIYCHSGLNVNNFGWLYDIGTKGMGHEHTLQLAKAGFPEIPFKIFIPNITPANLNNWSDGALHRAITSGIGNKDNVLFPMMPYDKYKDMADEDVRSIIAYLRTMEPIEKDWPATKVPFPFSLILRTLPKPYEAKDMPDQNNEIAYGKYLTTIALCESCHTPLEGNGMNGKPIKGMELAGGQEFNMASGGIVRSANLRPDKETGIGSWDRQKFIDKFKKYEGDMARKINEKDKFTTLMPWQMYAGMSADDLGAIYAYLMSLEPIENEVVNFWVYD